MGSIIDGQPVNQTITNDAKVDRHTDDQIYGIIDLLSSDPASGPTLSNMQGAINDAYADAKIFITTATHQKVSFDGTSLDSPEDILITMKDTGFVNTILAAYFPMVIPDGFSVYVTLNRTANVNLSPVVLSSLPAGRNIFRVCTRVGTALLFWDNSLLRSGKSARIGEGSATGSEIGVEQEVPAGLIDGSNTDFVLSRLPLSDKGVLIVLNGRVVEQSEWSIFSTTITFVTPPAIGQLFYCWYLYVASGDLASPTVPVEYVEYPIVSALNISDKFLTLSNMPTNYLSVQVSAVGGVDQVYGTDYIVLGNKVDWTSLGLDGFLASGDQLIISYF